LELAGLMGSDDVMMTYRKIIEEVSRANVTSPQIYCNRAPWA